MKQSWALVLKWFKNHEDQFPLLTCTVRVVSSVQAATFKVREALALLATQFIWFHAEKVENLLLVKLNLNLLKEIWKLFVVFLY